MDCKCVIVDDIVEINKIIVGLLIMLNYLLFFVVQLLVKKFILLIDMFYWNECTCITGNEFFCIFNILIHCIHDVKYMLSILSYLN